jgi:hypothetical protein
VGTYCGGSVNDSTLRIQELQALDSRALAWYAALHPTLRYSTETFSSFSRLDSAPAFVFIHALYHASLALLYYSLVLSISANPQSTSVASIPLLTSSALEHANSVSSIIRDLFMIKWDITRTPAFLGYAAYVASTVQLSYLWSQSPELAASAKSNIVLNLKLMRTLGPYWAVVEQVVCRLSHLFANRQSINTLMLYNVYAAHRSESASGRSNIPTSVRFDTLSPSILRYGLVMWDLESQEAQPQQDQIHRLSIPDKPQIPVSIVEPAIPDPFENLFSDMAPASTEQFLDVFPDLSLQSFLHEEPPQEYSLISDFMENLWGLSIPDTSIASSAEPNGSYNN